MEKQKYRIEFWKNGKKLVSKVTHELPRIGAFLAKDFYITRSSDKKYTVKEIKEVENTGQNTFVKNKDNNGDTPKDKSYIMEVE